MKTGRDVMEDAFEYLKSMSVRPSVQRVAVTGYLLANRVHPTAEQVYAALAAGGLRLSRATVYNTLRLLVRLGAVAELDADARNTRYDIDTSFHAHFVCDRCGGITDVRVPDNGFVRSNAPHGTLVRSVQMVYRGLCGACAAEETVFC